MAKSNIEIPLDVQLMKEIASAAAQAAAETVADKVRHEMRAEHKTLRDELEIIVKKEIKAYHGDMTPTQHAIQHNRMDRLLNWTDKISQNFWGQLVSGFVKWAVMLFLLGYFVITSGADKIPGVSG